MSYSYRSTKSSSVANKFARGRSGQRRQNNNRPKHGQYIDPSRFVKVATATQAKAYNPSHRFSDFDLNGLLKRNLANKGYETPSPIQDQAIVPALEGQDVIGIAGTGTGKTAAFALPVLHQLMQSQHGSALIVAPTRELAQQIEQEIRELSAGSNLKTAVLIGGTGMGGQLRDLRAKPRVIIGTPGRIKDHLERRTLQLGHCKFVVLDEVDRMLDMGFVHDVRHILSLTSTEKQSFFFSATMDPRVRSLIETFAKEPVTISIKPSATSDNIHQDVVHYAGNSEKLEKLHELLIDNQVTKVIVFDETQRSVERLGKELVTRGFAAESIHGGKSQGQRQRALKKFKQNEATILVATDVAARGIDVADVTHVINFSVPKQYDDYIHRIGRAGRAGRTGYALTFISR